ncbi:MAG: nicotinate-nucleotide--dimethylbenzimidazole phosphoribosyltransferase [Pseudomonadota bacterium]
MTVTVEEFEVELRSAIDGKTKPVGALGRIETLAAQIARIHGTLSPKIETCALTIFAADHGIATAGVSAYPQAVTRQMVLNFLAGGAAANVFAKSVGADVQVVDAGIVGNPIEHSDLTDCRIGPGTANAIERPAMTSGELGQALEAGRSIGESVTADVICFGEMGIGNTSAASLIAAKLLGQPVAVLVGRGTGLDDEGLARKRAILAQAAARTPDKLTAEIALCEYGGFEIAMMAAAMTIAAKAQRIIIVDGFISSVAALCAVRLAPSCRASLIFAHRSAEVGHGIVLDALGAEPLLDLDMRLGEGTGALLAFPLVKAAASILRDMASFESANISGPA